MYNSGQAKVLHSTYINSVLGSDFEPGLKLGPWDSLKIQARLGLA